MMQWIQLKKNWLVLVDKLLKKDRKSAVSTGCDRKTVEIFVEKFVDNVEYLPKRRTGIFLLRLR